MCKKNNVKVLQVTGGFRKDVSGGIPSVLYNYCTAPAFHDNQVAFDYLSLGYQTFEPYREELEHYGGTLFNLDIHSSGIKLLVDIFKRLRKFIKAHNYDIIHINSGALTQVLVSALAAKSAGGRKIIVHSHNAMIKTQFRETIYRLIKPLFYFCTNKYYACAEIAAASMFPKDILKNHKWTLVPNAIQIERFEYNEEIRQQYRKKYGLENKFVIGHVGRFNEQKNHDFLIDIFAEVSKKRADAMLLLVGTGDLKAMIEDKVKRLDLTNRVIFTGQRRDANCFMQAMDLFAFPSIYEGLGMVLIEAQTSGLKTISSDKVPINETRVTDCIEHLSLSDKSKWIQEICVYSNGVERKSHVDEIINAGYELKKAAENLKDRYLQL